MDVLIKDETGILIIHRDLAITHTDGSDCVCEPMVISEDDPRTPEQIVCDLNKLDVKH